MGAAARAWCCALVVGVAAAACTSAEDPLFREQWPDRVSGTIAVDPPQAIPAGARVRVALADVSLQDVAATLIAEREFTADGSDSLEFEIRFDPGAIKPTREYAVQVRVQVGGRLAFINTTSYRVITRGRPTSLDVVVEPIRARSRPSP